MRRRAPAVQHLVVHTGQHYDREMSDVFLDDLGLGEPDYLLEVGSGSHGEQTGRALERIEAVLLRERPAMVVVPGDVNSTLAGALAAAKLRIPVAHLEAGLRSFDRSMPEELNRVLVDQIADVCLTHSAEAEANLMREGVENSRIHFVGNTMIDSLVRLLPRAAESSILDRLGLQKDEFLLVTLHRPGLVDGPNFVDFAIRLAELGEALPLVFPVHPRTRARLDSMGFALGGMRLVEPLGYLDFLALETSARGVITDSGGVQEETTYLGVPCFTIRENTERPITLQQGTNHLIGIDPHALRLIPEMLARPFRQTAPPPGWDGRASERAANVLLDQLTPGATSALAGEETETSSAAAEKARWRVSG